MNKEMIEAKKEERIEAIKEGIAIDLRHINLLIKEYLKEIGQDIAEAYWHAYYIKHAANDKSNTNLDVGVAPWKLTDDGYMVPETYKNLVFMEE